MTVRRDILELVLICVVVLLLAVAGLVWTFLTGLEFDIDGLLLLLVCLLMGGLFSLMLLMIAKEAGWLARLPIPRRKAAVQAVTGNPVPAVQEVNGLKIKVRKPKQRACDEKDDKGKLCNGHLKRWYEYPKEIEAIIGPKAEIYRCEFCKTLYRPDLSEMPHSYTLRY